MPWLAAALLAATFCAAAIALLNIRRYRRVLRRSERYCESVEHLPVGFYRSLPNGAQIYANPALVRLNGYASQTEMLAAITDIGAEWYVEPNRRAEFKLALERDGYVVNFVSQIYRHKTRQKIWVSEDARLVRDTDSGATLYYEGTVREVTETIRREQSEERLEKLADNLPGGLFQMRRHPDGTYEIPYASRRFRTMLGMNDHVTPIDPQPFFKNIHASDRRACLASVDESARLGQVWEQDFRYRGPDDSWIWVGATSTPERLADGGTLWHGYIADLSERKRAEEKIEKLAYFDSLTGLPNRRMFTGQLERAIAANKKRGEHAALLYLDLDNFKNLNDSHGHELGDRLLQEVARRLRESVRARDTVSRFGGDEFVILLDGLGGDRARAAASATGAANKILRGFGRGFELGKLHHPSTPSIGVAVFDASNGTAADIIKGADVAMYEAKKRGRNNFVIFDPVGLHTVARNYQLQRELAGAIERGELILEFQPQIDLGGSIFGAEALVRWDHPTRGVLAPGEFVPIAEMTGAISEINAWVFAESMKVLSRWRKAPHLKELGLSLNVSVQQFRSPDFPDRLAEILKAAGIDGARLTLELTEHAMARDSESVAERMRGLKKFGIRFSLDDFGTGYASLSLLNAFPFDEVKIDGAFVSQIEHRESNRTLIEAILGMANALGMDTVAEHVGNQHQLDFLRARGCSRFQGFHFHASMKETDLVALVERQSETVKPNKTLAHVAAPSLEMLR